MNLRCELESGVEELGLKLSSEQLDLLIQYLHLLDKWNKAYNLSAVRDIRQMLSRHLLDSLVILDKVEGERFLDVGTGAGLPGIPLAICYPDKRFTLLDSNGKKTRFLFQVKTELGLSNVNVVCERVESFQAEGFDAITSRAYASLDLMVASTQHLLAPDGRYYALKGQYPESELSEIAKPFKVHAIEPLCVQAVTATDIWSPSSAVSTYPVRASIEQQ